MANDHPKNDSAHSEKPSTKSHSAEGAHASRDSNGAHHDPPKYNQKFKDNTAWMYMFRAPYSYLEEAIDRLKGHHHPHPYNINELDDLPRRKQIPRVVFAFEKLNALNHHAFSEKEARLYSPTRVGVIQMTYSNILVVANVYWLVSIFTKRNFSANNLRNAALFTLANLTFLRPLPLELKERWRYLWARRAAKKYLKARNGDMSEVKTILDPKTPVEHLFHFRLAAV
jgi:hypothetical protein